METTELIEALKTATGRLIGIQAFDDQFTIILGAALFSLLLFGKLIANSIFKADKSFIITSMAILIPVAITIAGLAAIDLFVIESVEDETMKNVVIYSGAAILFLGPGIFIGKILLDLQWKKTLFAFLLILTITGCTIFATNILLDTFSIASKNVEKGKEKRQGSE